jgi:hypothetical protein
MRRALVGFSLVLLPLLAACSGARPGADLPPQYAAAPAAPTADLAASVLPVLPTGDPALDRLLTEVASAFERHDWRALAYTLDAAAYAEQFAFLREGGRSSEAAAAQVLEETFDLGTVGNEVFPLGLDRETRPFAGLDRIHTISLVNSSSPLAAAPTASSYRWGKRVKRG